MATFVLVAGATLGAWCWKRVTPLLRKLGHDVYPLTLTGLAERAHLASASVNLDTHIQDIVSLIEVEELTDVILVGHSLSVQPVSGAADRIPQRIAQLVYFDSLPVVENGRSTMAVDNPDDLDINAVGNPAWVLARVTETERGPMFEPPDFRIFGLDEADIKWTNSKATPHPFNSWNAVVHYYNEAALARIPKTFIACIGDNAPEEFRDSRSEGMHFYELPFGHMAMVNAPQEVTDLFQTIATQL